MFGYVRPLKPELKLREYEAFRAAYCGLCMALRKRYGLLARYAVNYDLTFLAMLLAPPGEMPEVCRRCCPASPCRKKQYFAAAGFDAAADLSILLVWWKLKDAAADGRGREKLTAKLLGLLLRGKARRAAAAQPAFAALAEENLRALSALEQAHSASLDAVADKFAAILAAAAEAGQNEAERRILRQLLYQLGRHIYILDAVDDYEEDCRQGAYNPLLYRFETGGRPLAEPERALLDETLRHSEALIASAYALKEKNGYDDILANIIYLGLGHARELVFAGRGKELKVSAFAHRREWRSEE